MGLFNARSHRKVQKYHISTKQCKNISLLKESYKCENYLLLNVPFNYISVLSQLHSGILPLHVETGGYMYVNKPVEER